MTNDELRQLRRRIESTPANRRGRRQYDEALRNDVVNYAASRHALGLSYTQIAESLKLPSATLLHWRQRARSQRKARKRPVGFRPVALRKDGPRMSQEPGSNTPSARSGSRAEATVSRPVVVLPGGVRIEGVAIGELAALVRSMGCLR